MTTTTLSKTIGRLKAARKGGQWFLTLEDGKTATGQTLRETLDVLWSHVRYDSRLLHR